MACFARQKRLREAIDHPSNLTPHAGFVQSHPSYRLPAMYVLDSISKNIGAPYVSLWSQRIAHLFLETYRLVDQPTKVRLEELLNTWRTGGQGGQPLYGGEAQWEIERNLYGSRGPPSGIQPHLQPPGAFSGSRASPRPATHSPVPPPGQANDHARRSRMVEQIDRLLALGTQDQYRNPQAFSQARMSALAQLKTVVQTATLSSTETDQIQQQLDTLTKESEQSRVNSSLSTPAPSAAPASAPPGLPANIGSALENLSKSGSLNGATNSPVPQNNVPHSIPALAVPASSPSGDLISSLVAAGLLPATAATSPASSAVKSASQDDAYTAAIMNIDIKLTSLDLQKEPPQEAVNLVCHQYLPLQCRQCANRYPAGVAGQRTLEKHLDWHFKQGRKAKDSSARGLSRSWLEKAFDWIRGGADDPSASAAGGSGGSSSSANKGLSVQQEAELKAASEVWVAAPADASLANAPCAICKEKFQSEWSEDEEEWIWKNARKVEGSYYHGSCYYSAKALSANVSSRTTTPPGRRSTDRRSRTATPPRKAASNPVERVKSETEGESATGKKRKESPAIAEGAAEGFNADEEQQSKKVAT